MEHGHLVVPTDYRIDGVYLSKWISSQRTLYKKGRLSEDKIIKLENIGMFWGSLSERTWLEQFSDTKQYYCEHGDLNIPLEYVSESGRKTRYWLDRQRNNFKNGNLSSKQIELLKSIHAIS